MDNKAFDFLKNETSLNIINSEEFESNKLKNIKKLRKMNEYCWTLKPIGIIIYLKNLKIVNGQLI